MAAGWALGTSADVVYTHYTTYGAGEGRKPYNAATLDMANILPYQGTDSTTTQPAETEQSTTPMAETEQSTTPATSPWLPEILIRNGRQLTNENTIMAVEGQSYPLNKRDYSLNVSFRYVPTSEIDAASRKKYALDPLPGYEWREVQIICTDIVADKNKALLINTDLYVHGSYAWDYINDKEKYYGEINGTKYMMSGKKFELTLLETDYPECEVWNIGASWLSRNVIQDDIVRIFVLVPENYERGGMSLMVGRGEGWSSSSKEGLVFNDSIRFDF